MCLYAFEIQSFRPMASVLFFIAVLIVFFIKISALYEGFEFDDYKPVDTIYNRYSEVEKHCLPFLSQAYDLEPDDTRGQRLKTELYISNGDWEQELGGSPLIPFDETDIPEGRSSPTFPLKLISFGIHHVNPVHHSKNTVSVKGSMNIHISRNGSAIRDTYSKFFSLPGSTMLTIYFEGVYFETNENGKDPDRGLCLLGKTRFPFWKWFDDPLDLAKSHWSRCSRFPRLMQHDQISLVLRYPQTFNLTKSVVRGEMMSLDGPGSFKYFDKVHVSSKLSCSSKYQFSSDLKSRACYPDPLRNEMNEDGVNKMDGSEFCRMLDRVSHEGFKLIQNYNKCSEVGPFLLGKEVKGSERSYENIRLVLQHIKCEPESTKDAKVFSVFRAVHASVDQSLSAGRTGLSSTTLVAEGTWYASSGILCMVACLGPVDSGLHECNWQILLYFPRIFSIRQRSLIFGSLSSISSESTPFSPLLFHKPQRPVALKYDYDTYCKSGLSYNYSVIESAILFKKRTRQLNLKQLLMKYPALEEDREEESEQLAMFGGDLEFNAYAFHDTLFNNDYTSRIFVRLEVLSVGSLFGPYVPWLYKNDQTKASDTKLTADSLLNVSMHLIFTEAPLMFDETMYGNVSSLFLEGIYDPLTGEMHSIGCRRIVAVAVEIDAARGLDCLVEVYIQYPPRTTRWLKNPTVKITINSQRNNADKLSFNPISLRTLTIKDDKQNKDMFFRRIVEWTLRIVLLILSSAITLDQLFYSKENGGPAVSYVSLLMLSFQILGYSMSLINGTEALFSSKGLDSSAKGHFAFQEYGLIFKAVEYIGKFLVLAALMLTWRLFQIVSESRAKAEHAPTEKKVILMTLGLHSVGVILLFQIQPVMAKVTSRIWLDTIEEYGVLVQDLFLLPQSIGNLVWQFPVKPLKKSYYVGFTCLRLILHVYECVQDPVLDAYSIEAESIIPYLNLSSVLGNLVTTMIIIMLAIVVHVQQSSDLKEANDPVFDIHIE